MSKSRSTVIMCMHGVGDEENVKARNYSFKQIYIDSSHTIAKEATLVN